MSERGRAAIALAPGTYVRICGFYQGYVGLWPLADIHFDVTNIRSWG